MNENGETQNGTTSSSERLKLILEAVKHQIHTSGPRSLGTSFKPRTSTQLCVDAAANEIAMAILHEPKQVASRLLELYTAYVSVRTDGTRCRREDISRGTAYEWDAKKIINHRIMDWYRYEAFKGDHHRLCYGQVAVDLYHRCQKTCVGHQNELIDKKVAGTKYTLHGCAAGGMIHLCRHSTINCLSLSPTAETSVVCMASGNVLMEEGLSQVWAQGKPGGTLAKNRPELLDACHLITPQVKAKLPENQRRAKVIGVMLQTGCPQIISWDASTGELILDFTRPFPEMNSFDPTLLWEVPKYDSTLKALLGGGAQTDGYGPESLGVLWTASNIPGGSIGCTDSPEPEEATLVRPVLSGSGALKSVALKRRRKHQIRRGGAIGTSATSATTTTTNRDRQIVVRVLKDVLWDPDTRYMLNQRGVHKAHVAAEAAILAEMNSPAYLSRPTTATDQASQKGASLVCGLLAHLAQRHQTHQSDKKVPKRRLVPILSHMGTVVHRVCRETLIPIVLPRPNLEAQLVQCILYLWNFVMHLPEVPTVASDASKASLPKQKRNPTGKAATLTQFALGFLYTAAGIGIELNKKVGWPKDWWLWNNLPSADSIHHYGRPRRKRRASKVARGRWDVLATFSKTAAAAAPPENKMSFAPGTRSDATQVAFVYQMKDITRGKRALGEAVSEYTGEIPKASEVVAYLRQAYEKIHQNPPPPPPNSSGKFTELRKSSLKRSRNDDGATTTTTTLSLAQKAMNRLQERNAKSLRFCCMYLSSDSARRHHLCVTFNPWDSTGAPGLSPQAMRKGQWSLGLIVGPFVKEADARSFCIEWGRCRCDTATRRQQGVKLANHVGLQIWGSQATPAILTPAMHAAAESQKQSNLTARRRLRAARTQRLVEVMRQGNRSTTACLIPVRQPEPDLCASATTSSWQQTSRSSLVPMQVVCEALPKNPLCSIVAE